MSEEELSGELQLPDFIADGDIVEHAAFATNKEWIEFFEKRGDVGCLCLTVCTIERCCGIFFYLKVALSKVIIATQDRVVMVDCCLRK